MMWKNLSANKKQTTSLKGWHHRVKRSKALGFLISFSEKGSGCLCGIRCFSVLEILAYTDSDSAEEYERGTAYAEDVWSLSE